MSSSVLYQITEVDPTSPLTEGKVYQVHKVTAEEAPFIGGKTYNAIMIKDPDDPLVSGKVYQATFIADPTDPTVKGKVYNAIVEGDSEIVIIGPAVSPLSLPDAIANSLEYVKAFGGTEQRNLPDGYTELEYIESTGTQYIDTGLTVNDGDITATAVFTPTTLVVDGTSGYSAIFGRNSNLQAGYTSTGYANIGNASSSGIFFAANTQATVSAKLSPSSANKYYVNGADTGLSRTFARSFPVFLFTSDTSQCFVQGKMYSFTAQRNDEIIMNLVPAKRVSDNVVGMYDTVSGTFFTNAGTGNFVAGADVTPTPDTPMDIISNNGVLKVNTNSYSTEYHDMSLSQTDGVTTSSVSGINVSAMVNCTNVKSFMVTNVNSTGSYRLFQYKSDGTFINAAAIHVFGGVIQLSSDCGYFRIQYGYTATGTENILIYNSAYSLDEIYADGTVETINVHGKNLLNDTNVVNAYNATGNYTYKGYFVTSISSYDNSPLYRVAHCVLPAGSYRFETDTANAYMLRYAIGSAITELFSDNQKQYIDFTLTTTTEFSICWRNATSTEFTGEHSWISKGSTATAYEPYFDGGTATAEMLLKVGNYQDEQEILSGAITRNVGVKVFDGTENWALGVTGRYYLNITPAYAKAQYTPLCSHFQMYLEPGGTADMTTPDTLALYTGGVNTYQIYAYPSTTIANSLAAWKQWLANQYNAGTPVTIVYPLATPTTESVAGQAMQVQAGDNTLEITQASLDNLELEAKYSKEA